jgi:hypothetical protein
MLNTQNSQPKCFGLILLLLFAEWDPVVEQKRGVLATIRLQRLDSLLIPLHISFSTSIVTFS